MSMQKYLHYLNGKYLPEEKLLISPRDLGFSRGYGVFDYLRTYNGKPFKIEGHLARLLRSAKAIELTHNYSLDQLIEIVREILKINDDGEEKQMRITLSGGVSTSMCQENEASLIVIIDKFKPKPPEIYEVGIRMNLVKFLRYKPVAKNTNYIEGVIQASKGKKNGFYEPLFYGEEQVYEGSNSNIFAVKNGSIYTPKNNVFYGGTRGVLVDDLKDVLEIIEKDFNLNFLLGADEAFICSSGKEVVSVVGLDDHIIGDGKIGKVTRRVAQEFKKYVASGVWFIEKESF